MGKMQREKGKTFERKIAGVLRRRWPSAIVRRASQAERAYNPDVFVEGVPVLERIWLELQDAREPTPRAKLEQAEDDILDWSRWRNGIGIERLPIVVWHKLGERRVWVTTRCWVFDVLRGRDRGTRGDLLVTFVLDDLLDLLEAAP